jgi:DNA-binding SARP family transcriptional activator
MATRKAHVDLTAGAAFAVQDDMRIVAWNQGAEDLLGHPAGEAIGRPCYEVLQAVRVDGKPLCVADCNGDLCFGRCPRDVSGASLALHKDQSRVPIDLKSFLSISDNGDLAGSTSTIAVVALQPGNDQGVVPAAGPVLGIRMLGRFALAVEERIIPIEKWHRKQAVTLLKYLSLHPGVAVHREQLIDILWPDANEARGQQRLKVTVHCLRRQLRTHGLEQAVIETSGKAYLLRPEAVWIDVEAHRNLAAEGAVLFSRQRWREARHCYDKARSLYRGPFLAEDPYADWCANERAAVVQRHMEMLSRLVQCHTAIGNYAEAVEVCREALDLDPCEELFHRACMQNLMHLSDFNQAARQFRHCEQILQRELGVEPSPETLSLYRQIPLP